MVGRLRYLVDVTSNSKVISSLNNAALRSPPYKMALSLRPCKSNNNFPRSDNRGMLAKTKSDEREREQERNEREREGALYFTTSGTTFAPA